MLLSSALLSEAVTYKIIFLNTPTVTIGGRKLAKGDTFDGNLKVTWEKDRQAMKVMDISTKLQKLIVSDKAMKNRWADVDSYISGEKKMSARGGAPANAVELGAILNDTFYFMDAIDIKTAMPTDSQRFFYISYPYNGETINKMVENREGTFVITPEIFTIDGKAIPPFDTTLSVYYVDQEKETLTLVSDKMRVVLIN